VSSNWFPAKSVEQMIVEQSNFEQFTPTHFEYQMFISCLSLYLSGFLLIPIVYFDWTTNEGRALFKVYLSINFYLILKKNKLYNFSKLLSCVVFNVSINGKMSEIKFLRTILWCAYVILITFQSTHKLYYFNLFGNEYLLKKKFKLYLLTHFLSDRMC
jgi:hypothetical protein